MAAVLYRTTISYIVYRTPILANGGITSSKFTYISEAVLVLVLELELVVRVKV